MTLAIPESDAAPTEFRLFRAGANETTKGTVLFDTAAAELVMSAYTTHAVDVHIDLEHLALDSESESYDPDARGWAKLELRGGELWATNVSWTEDGADRLRTKRQRYISPAFHTDKDNRVTELVNIALTGLPATHEAPALVAASKLERLSCMTPELVKQLIEAIEKDDPAALKEVAKALLAEATGGDGDGEGDGEDGEPSALADDADDKKPDPAHAAALTALCALTGRKSAGEAVATVTDWGRRISTLEKREAALELDARRELVGELVQLGVELPATAWEGDADARNPCSRLSIEPVEDLRSRVTQLRAAQPVKRVLPPTRTAPVTLSAAEKAACKARGLTVEEFTERKANAVRRA